MAGFKPALLYNSSIATDLESGIKYEKTRFLFGYDNFALSLEGEELTEKIMTSQKGIRECTIKKEPEEEFEFFLKVDDVRKGQLITSITEGGPADRAGAKDGDRVIEVNGSNVEDKNHSQVVDLIRESIPKNLLVFKVVDEANDPNTPKPVETPVFARNGHSDTLIDLRPRICKIPKLRNTFGFSLQATTNAKSGHFVKGLIEGGPAVESGLRENDRIIEVGGVNVEKLPHEKVVGLVKKSGSKVTLLVVDEDTYRHFMAKKIKIKAKRAVSTSEHVISNPRSQSTTTPLSSSDIKARIVHVTKANNQGYGFFLRVKKNEEGEFLGSITKGMAASECGLMEDDLVVAINGTIVFNKEHDDVIKMVKDVPQHVVFLVLGPEAQKNASQKGILSTLVGAKEMLPEKPRVVHVTKGEDGYGFYLKMEMNSPLHIIGDVEDGSAAMRAGLKDGEVVVCVGDYDVTNKSHDDTVGKIKEAGGNVALTVGSRQTMDLIHKLKISVTQEFLDNWPAGDAKKVPDFTEFDQFLAGKLAEKVSEKISRQPTYAKINKTRTCELVRGGSGFGFFLRDEDGHLLCNVEKGGAAEKAGVMENDRIIEVDGQNVESETHDQVVNRIRDAGEKVTFLVINSVKHEVVHPAEAAVAKSLQETSAPLPRICVVTKGDRGFGFHLNGETEGRPGQYIRRVVGNEAADVAGLKNGDRVIEINELSITGKTHEEVVKMIVESGNKITFLVVDEEADLYYTKKNIVVTAAILGAKVANENNEAAMSRSSSTSTITEASVHVDPEEGPEIDFPPPPDAQSLRESLHSQREAIDQLDQSIEDDDVIESLNDVIQEAENEVKEDLVEEAKEEFVEQLTDDVREEIAEAIQEQIADDVAEQIADDVAEQIADDVAEQIADDVAEQIADDVAEKIADDVAEKIADDIAEKIADDVAEKIADDVAEKIADDVAEKIADDVAEKIADDVAEKIADDVAEKIADDVAEKIADDVAEQIADDVKEEIAEEVKEEIIDDVTTAIKIAAAAAIVSEVREEAEERTASRSSSVEDPPSSPISRGKPTRQSNPPAIIPMGRDKENLESAVSALRSVQKGSQASTPSGGVSNDPPTNTPPSFRNARAMFEKSGKPPPQKPSWVRPAPAKPAANGDIKKQAAQPSAKPLAKKVSANGMMFNIVETSSVFN